jgi:hypothetical protein
MDGSMSNADNPRLSIWKALEQSIRCGQDFVGNLESASFNVDRHDFTVIVYLNLLTHLSFIDLIAAKGEFRFTISGLPHCHGLGLISTLDLQFNLSG